MRTKHENPTTDIQQIENGIWYLAQIDNLIEKPSVIMMIQRLEKLISTDADDPDSPEVNRLIEYPHADEIERNLALMKFEKRNSKGSGKSGGKFSDRPKQ
ncbi:hypothetical protein [uncultured Shewanella sp.]|uniref:hypothetical protein n=1 Tax=uncultured Shewanella sp. TaxID=173975 RepID=UPI00262DF010|nr:hypothetical protein [uncultured Shewanella sp.]